MKITKAFPAVAERADFGPAYNGEDYVTLTFRVPKDTPAMCGIFDITPRCAGTLPWAEQKHPIEE